MKSEERRLKWYGLVTRRDEVYVCKRVTKMGVEEMIMKGRPKRRWVDSLNVDLREKGLSGEETQNLVVRRQQVRYNDRI